ncbi:unnamed protein product [Euphydryas editha]|uniref:Uncharacterized protein n=1 Tax=Euphydryas editha TaxID=104508 RepID=A0AAU9V082_EUPED|nr:unnamed protein product [Euphydryas editha]
MTDPRTSSALFKRAEQLKRWEESDTNKQSSTPKRASRIQFSSGIVFLAACTAGDKDEVQKLLKMGADINTANVDGLTALHQVSVILILFINVSINQAIIVFLILNFQPVSGRYFLTLFN